MGTNLIRNPILKGFHPDPSIIRVGEDYYIATSTFEWWPGVRLHHSKDMVNWELIEYPLNRVSQLDLRGVGASQGIWAPCLTYHDGTFYLLYTVVTAFYCNMYDTNNYLVTAQNIHGPWSEPVPLNNFGFDPSLFHDEDGRKYVVSMATDHRVPKKYAGRLVLQEYDHAEQKMVGPIRDIYTADKIFLEGPHIFKRNGWYYLFAADTGTGELHGQSILRSRSVWGPYDMYQADYMRRDSDWEAWSILTARHYEDIPLQKAGHCDLVETRSGEWYAVHLCGRPLDRRNPEDAPRFAGSRRYPLGRETAIQKMRWTEGGWLVLDGSGTTPQEFVPAPTEAMLPQESEKRCFRDDFTGQKLSLEYQSLRIPMTEQYLSLTERPGCLRMFGRSGLASRFSQSLIAVRLTEFDMEISTRLEFEPECFKQMAGLIVLYDTDNYFYLHISHDEDCGKCVTLLKAENKKYEYLTTYLPIPAGIPVELQAVSENFYFTFSYRLEGGAWRELAIGIDGSFLSDEACAEGWFTGTMAGLCCQDLVGMGQYADFHYFEVKEI
ncbi:MAG: glycoside hydrolase family 43 protein [Oscillospiraceae bacterium]|nr:glycoside hydrolase family 43 protein [Oscillospiraceae bacterium]